MNARFDMNLVRVFCTLYDTGSLTKTADLLEISQPAISHSLKKLRQSYGDQLFVRNDGKMIPTNFAEQLSPSLKKSFELITSSLTDNRLNHQLSLKDKFTFTMSDMSQAYFIPPLCLILENLNSQIGIDIIQTQQRDIDKLMQDDQLDFAIGHLPMLVNKKESIICEKLFEDKFVFMVREGHPLLKNDTILSFKDLQLVGVKSGLTGHTELVENICAEYNKNILLSIPNYSAAPEIVIKTDYGVIIPLSFAKKFNFENQFRIFDIKLPGNIIDVNIFYHKLYKNDVSIQWMLKLILDNFKGHL